MCLIMIVALKLHVFFGLQCILLQLNNFYIICNILRIFFMGTLLI